MWDGFNWLEDKVTWDTCNESLRSVIGGEFLNHLSDYPLLKTDSVPQVGWLVG
jgi:hypothetical protein